MYKSIVIFRPHKFISVEGVKSPSVLRFFKNSVRNPLSDDPVSYCGWPSWQSACQSEGQGFEPGLKHENLFCNTSVAENFNVLSARLVTEPTTVEIA